MTAIGEFSRLFGEVYACRKAYIAMYDAANKLYDMDKKTWSGFPLGISVLFVFSRRYHIDTTESYIKLSHPHQTCLHDGRSESSGSIALLKY